MSGFPRLGTQQVISTLWPISSDVSTIVMIRFYQLFSQGIPAPQALHQTQICLRSSTHPQLKEWLQDLKHQGYTPDPWMSRQIDSLIYDQDFSDPYYWAAFVLTGISTEPVH